MSRLLILYDMLSHQLVNHRSISKTFQDNSGVRSSADIGISGTYTPGRLIRVRVMMSNGNGFKSKDDDADEPWAHYGK